MRTINESASYIREVSDDLEKAETKEKVVECLTKLEEAYNERILIFSEMGKEYEWHKGYTSGVDNTLKMVIEKLEKIK